MMKSMAALVAPIALSTLLVPYAAEAGPARSIPSEWGGGTVSVDLPDFTYPQSSGCYNTTGAMTLVGNDIEQWDTYTLDLEITDAAGTVMGYFYVPREGYATTIRLANQLCSTTDVPGLYTVSGSIEFDYEASDGETFDYTVPLTDNYTVTGYVPPAPSAAPVVSTTPAVTTIAPSTAAATGQSAACRQAKKALKSAKKKSKPSSVVTKAKKKVQRAC